MLSGSFVFHVQVETGSAAIGDGGGRRGLDVVAWAARWLILAGGTVLAGAAILRVVVRGPVGWRRPGARRYVVAAAAAWWPGPGCACSRRWPRPPAARCRGPRAGGRGGHRHPGRPARALRLLAAVVGCWGRGLATGSGRRVRGAGGAAGVMVVNALGGHAFTSDRPSLAVLSDVVHQYGGGDLGRGPVCRGRAEPQRRGPRARPAADVLPPGAGRAGGGGRHRSGLGLGRSEPRGPAQHHLRPGVGHQGRGGGDDGRLRLVEPGPAAGGGGALRRGAWPRCGPRRCWRWPRWASPRRWWGWCRPGSSHRSVLRDAVRRRRAGDDEPGPGPARANSRHLYFFDEAGQPRAVDAAEARVQQGDLPPRRVDLVPIRPDHYSAAGVSLPQPGRWRVTITTISRGTPSETTFEVPIR